MGLVFQLIDQADLPNPQYEDVFARMNYRLSPTQSLGINVLHAGDRYTYDIAATTGSEDTIQTREAAKTRYGNSNVWSTLQSSFGPRTTARTTVSGGSVTRSRDGSERAVQLASPFYSVTNDRRFSIRGIAQDWTHGLSDRDIISFGADFRSMRNSDSYRTEVSRNPDDPAPDTTGVYPIRTSTGFSKSGSRLALYVSNRVRVASPLVVETGVRYDRATWTGDSDFSPRVSAALGLGRGMTLRLGWGHYRQMQGLDDVAALNGPARYYRSELSEQWTAGLERTGGEGERFRVEGYFKRGSNLRPVFRNWKGSVDAFPEPNEDRILVFPRSTMNEGIEAYFDRPISGSLSARASYSYSMADEDVNGIMNVNSTDPLAYDRSHSGPQDQRHAANLDLTWRVRGYSLNGSFAYHSGWPATLEQLVAVTNEDGDPDVAVRPVKLYGARLPDYLRFDMRVTRRWETRWGRLGGSLEVINATSHANVFGYDYFRNRQPNGQIVLLRGDETWFSILPSVGLTWSRSF